MTQPLTKMPEKQLGKQIVEALLFSSSEPVSLRKLKDILYSLHPFTLQDIKELIELLKNEYEEQGRAFQIEEIAEGYLLRTRAEYNAYIQQLIKQSRPERLSHATLEVLAIIAYKQPITRPQIDQIRGVDSSGIIHTLIDRQLIEPAGKLEVPGRPTLYTVTHRFLRHFGLKNCSDLPGFPCEIRKEQPYSENNLIPSETSEPCLD